MALKMVRKSSRARELFYGTDAAGNRNIRLRGKKMVFRKDQEPKVYYFAVLDCSRSFSISCE